MQALVKKYNTNSEYFSSEQCYITEISNSTDDPDISIAQAKVNVGITTRWHRLEKTIERYYITSGEGQVELANLPAQYIQAGDVVIIPPFCKQRITNTGNTELIFIAICSPRFMQKNYHELE